MVQWPSFLMTTAKYFTLVKPDSIDIIHSGYGVYYGLSWNENEVYVAHREGIDSSSPEISVFDGKLSYKRSITGDFNDVHEILYANNSLYVTVTGYNSLVKVENDGSQQIFNWTKHKRDINHINSLWFDGDNFWVAYHNFVAKNHYAESRVVKVDKNLTKELQGINIGRDIHSVFVEDEVLYVGNSSNETLSLYNLKSDKQLDIHIGHWVRGLASTDSYILAGSSLFAERRNRLHGHCEVSLIDKTNLEIVDRRRFDDVGAVMGIRVISEVDYAHNQIPFPGKTRKS